MSENKTIKHFTASDIEKYWNNKLSPAEMHEMEKAAMDDPFLADALEGYRYSKNVDDEVKNLREKLNEKIDPAAAIIPVQRKKYAWLKIAAGIILLAGAGLLVQQLTLKSKSNESIAQTDKVKENNPLETIKTNETGTGNSSKASKSDSLSNQSVTVKTGKTEKTLTDLNSSFALAATDSSRVNDQEANLVYKNKETNVAQSSTAPTNSEFQKRPEADDKAGVAKAIPDSNKLSSNRRENLDATIKTKAVAQGASQVGMLNNSFRYRVVDAQNNPVPFANVMNTRDNIGTYTDVRGYFNLISSDSVMDVQIRSLGYNSENYRLVPSRQDDNLVLKEDATARSQINFGDRGGRVMSNVSRKDSAEVEEPEVGWGNYNTYVENNIKIPENIRARNAAAEVELSFDVDKSGQPVNIKVVKSSRCKECDEEAVRLLKEGPKWKKKGKKSRTTISIAVDQQ